MSSTQILAAAAAFEFGVRVPSGGCGGCPAHRSGKRAAQRP